MGHRWPEATDAEASRRERRRATQRARRAITGTVSWAVTGAILGAIIGAAVGYKVQGRVVALGADVGAAVAAAVGGALGALLGPLLVFGALFAWYFVTYHRRHIDEDWSAEHEDSIPGGLMLSLRRRAGPAMPAPTIDECWVRTDGPWIVIKDRDLPWMQDRIWYHYHFRRELEPGKTYEVRWFRMDGGEFAEVARESFRLRAALGG